jgi:hypothetical protein
MIHFTRHANDKFAVLKRHGVVVGRELILRILKKPDNIDYSRLPLFIAQGAFDTEHVLRVVFKQEGEDVVIITFYPARKIKYEEK